MYPLQFLWLVSMAAVVPLAFSYTMKVHHWRLRSALVIVAAATDNQGIDQESARVVADATHKKHERRKRVGAVFPHGRPPPFLALITEEDACDSDARTNATLIALQRAVSTNLVDLVSVRVRSVGATAENDTQMQSNHEDRMQRIVRQLMAWSEESSGQFRVVVSSNWIETGLRAGAHGVHFKEAHQERIQSTRQLYRTLRHANDDYAGELLVGTSTHSVESAVTAWKRHGPDYFFAGTCFATLSHPEKARDDLEGPALPAQVAAALDKLCSAPDRKRPAVLAIGGLDATNCQAQVTIGSYVDGANADGIATIRAVLCDQDPFTAVQTIKQSMMSA
jgi:thiamine monophosphate synthase